MKEHQILILCDEAGAAKPLAAKLAGAGFAVGHILPIAALGAQTADALVLVCDLQRESEQQVVRSLYISHPGCAVVLCAPKADVPLMKRAVLCGITAVIEQEDSAETAAQAVNDAIAREHARARAEESGPQYDGRILSVFGTKGGTGKTTLAVNLALSLARKKKTALLDLDLQFGDVAVFMDINKTDSVASLVEAGTFTQSAILSYMQPHPSGLMVLCAPPSPEYAELISAEHIRKILHALKTGFDYIVLDMPPVFNEISLAGLEESERIYFVTNPDISTLRNTKVSFEVFDSIRMSQKVELVLNKLGFSSIRQKTVEEILEKTPAFTVPHDPTRAVNAVNRGIPLVVGQPHCKMAQAITRYADSLTQPSLPTHGKRR
jgi:pilus assembly protein CpaE